LQLREPVRRVGGLAGRQRGGPYRDASGHGPRARGPVGPAARPSRHLKRRPALWQPMMADSDAGGPATRRRAKPGPGGGGATALDGGWFAICCAGPTGAESLLRAGLRVDLCGPRLGPSSRLPEFRVVSGSLAEGADLRFLAHWASPWCLSYREAGVPVSM